MSFPFYVFMMAMGVVIIIYNSWCYTKAFKESNGKSDILAIVSVIAAILTMINVTCHFIKN